MGYRGYGTNDLRIVSHDPLVYGGLADLEAHFDGLARLANDGG